MSRRYAVLAWLVACSGDPTGEPSTPTGDTGTPPNTEDTVTTEEPAPPEACRGADDALWADSSGNGNDGTFVGAMAWSGTGTSADPHALVFATGAASSGADTAYVVLPPSLAKSSDFTFEVWARSVAAPSYHHFLLWFRDGDPLSVNGWGLDDAVLSWSLYADLDPGPYNGWSALTISSVEPTWAYIAGSFDSAGDLHVHYNGVSEEAASGLPPIAYQGGSPSIGAPDPDSNFIGDVAVVRLWDRALTDDEILANYQHEAARFGHTFTGDELPRPTDAPAAWFDATPCP